MRRRQVPQGMVRLSSAVRDEYFEFLAAIAAMIRRRQLIAIMTVTMLTSLSVLFQTKIDAAGFAWWSQSKFAWFALALALAMIGPDVFGRSQGGGGAMRTSPAPAA